MSSLAPEERRGVVRELNGLKSQIEDLINAVGIPPDVSRKLTIFDLTAISDRALSIVRQLKEGN